MLENLAFIAFSFFFGALLSFLACRKFFSSDSQVAKLRQSSKNQQLEIRKIYEEIKLNIADLRNKFNTIQYQITEFYLQLENTEAEVQKSFSSKKVITTAKIDTKANQKLPAQSMQKALQSQSSNDTNTTKSNTTRPKHAESFAPSTTLLKTNPKQQHSNMDTQLNDQQQDKPAQAPIIRPPVSVELGLDKDQNSLKVNQIPAKKIPLNTPDKPLQDHKLETDSYSTNSLKRKNLKHSLKL